VNGPTTTSSRQTSGAKRFRNAVFSSFWLRVRDTVAYVRLHNFEGSHELHRNRPRATGQIVDRQSYNSAISAP
jgi:hypothetical protein